MRQILQHLKTGDMEVANVPCPQVGSGQVLIQTRASLISAGTERMLVEFSKSNILQKARSQPDKVKQVLDKMKTDGLIPTLEAVFRKLDDPMPMGYCNAGVVLEVGSGITDLQPGDRVISNGSHAEVVCVPSNLVAKIPDNVTDDQAAFTVLSSIALQGIRLVQPTLGEKIMVFGMGLIGLVTVQLLRASGCEVLGVDLNSERLALAESLGAKIVDLSKGTDSIVSAQSWTADQGVDAAIVTASAKNDEIMHQASESCRKRGRIILVGVVGLNLRRSDFYEKELTFQVSCSYGPGRYDETYEQNGQDYPIGYVRWTERRNFEAVLEAMATGRLNVDPLVTHRFALDEALLAYDKVQNDASALGILLEYPQSVQRSQSINVVQRPLEATGRPLIGIIGAGNFSVSTILPCLKKAGATLKYLAGRSNGAAVMHAARKFQVANAITDYRIVLEDKGLDAVFIVTRHNAHARFIVEALEAGKHVFVEKPLAINEAQLQEVSEAVRTHPDRMVMVGFNRRYSPHVQKVKQLLSGRTGPLCMTMTINAGEIPADNWIHDPDIGGGRIIGEACHFIDLLSYVAGSRIRTVAASMVGDGPTVREDKMSIMVGCEDGSVGTVNYFSNGSKSYPKEMLEVFSDGRVLRLENFRKTTGFGFQGFKKFKTIRQDKGHAAEIAGFVERLESGGEQMIAYEELENVTLACFAAVKSARTNSLVEVKDFKMDSTATTHEREQEKEQPVVTNPA